MWFDRLPEEMQVRVRPGQPQWRPPMLATVHEGELPRREWIFERKFDGQRVMAINDDAVRLITRNGIDVTAKYPDLVDTLPTDHVYVIDGEVVAFVDGHDSFAALQPRMHVTHADPSVPVYFLAFDILHLDGQDLAELPLAHRRGILQGLGLRGRAAVVPGTMGNAETLLSGACSAGWEGLVAKRLDAPYEHNRSPNWLKLKCLRSAEFVIGGYTAPRGSRTGFGALLLGEPTREGLRYAGKVGTGFNETELRTLTSTLSRLRRDESPFLDAPGAHATWVEPRLRCRVDFAERTADGRLRHPRYVGLRAPRRRTMQGPESH